MIDQIHDDSILVQAACELANRLIEIGYVERSNTHLLAILNQMGSVETARFELLTQYDDITKLAYVMNVLGFPMSRRNVQRFVNSRQASKKQRTAFLKFVSDYG